MSSCAGTSPSGSALIGVAWPGDGTVEAATGVASLAGVATLAGVAAAAGVFAPGVPALLPLAEATAGSAAAGSTAAAVSSSPVPHGSPSSDMIGASGC